MPEYIERDAAVVRIEGLAELTGDDSWAKGLRAAVSVLACQPAADVTQVVHGRWEKHKTMHGFVCCSACKDVYLDAEWLADGKWSYCPNCGAKMDGGVITDA